MSTYPIIALLLMVLVKSPVAFGQAGVMPISGGYENLIAAGKVRELGSGQLLDFVIAGGNHATGDLGFSFPWYSFDKGRLKGAGFNDMSVKIGTDVFYFSEVFQKYPGQVANKKLALWYDSQSRVSRATVELPNALEINSRETANLAFDFNLKEAINTVVREEGPKWAPDFLKEYLPGLTLKEKALSLDKGKLSYIKLYRNGQERSYEVVELTGALEESWVETLAFKEPKHQYQYRYDYLGVYPVDPSRCGNQGAVIYISGLLNPKRSWLHERVDEYLLRRASSAFLLDPEGGDVAISRIDRYEQMKSAFDVLNIKELGFVSGMEGSSAFLDLGVGTFQRRLVEFQREDGCRFMGMLETQVQNVH